MERDLGMMMEELHARLPVSLVCPKVSRTDSFVDCPFLL